MYADLTWKLLPAIQSWLTITKDYAFDLMWRYVKFLLITEVLYVIWILVMIYWVYRLFKFILKLVREIDDVSAQAWITIISCTVFLAPALMFGIDTINAVKDHSIKIIKLLTVPELIVAEDLRNFTSSK